MRIEVSDDIVADDIATIVAGLAEHAASAAIELRNAQPLYVLLRSDEGKLVAGLAATTVWGWLHVKELWVAAAERGSGVGTKLMHTAEHEARGRGCHHVLLDTFDFQARPFYEKLGYKLFGELSDFPRGHTRYFMSKQLKPE